MEHINEQLIVLLGESLLMDSIEAGLADEQNLGVKRMRSAEPEVAHSINALEPELVIFDLDATHLNSLLSYMRLQSGVPMLGVDINSKQVISLSCGHHPTSTIQQLRSVIDHLTINSRPDLTSSLFNMDAISQAVKS